MKRVMKPARFHEDYRIRKQTLRSRAVGRERAMRGHFERKRREEACRREAATRQWKARGAAAQAERQKEWREMKEFFSEAGNGKINLFRHNDSVLNTRVSVLLGSSDVPPGSDDARHADSEGAPCVWQQRCSVW